MSNIDEMPKSLVVSSLTMGFGATKTPFFVAEREGTGTRFIREDVARPEGVPLEDGLVINLDETPDVLKPLLWGLLNVDECHIGFLIVLKAFGPDERPECIQHFCQGLNPEELGDELKLCTARELIDGVLFALDQETK